MGRTCNGSGLASAADPLGYIQVVVNGIGIVSEGILSTGLAWLSRGQHYGSYNRDALIDLRLDLTGVTVWINVTEYISGTEVDRDIFQSPADRRVGHRAGVCCAIVSNCDFPL